MTDAADKRAAVDEKFRESAHGIEPGTVLNLDQIIQTVPLLNDEECEVLRAEEDALRFKRMELEEHYLAAQDMEPAERPADFDKLEMAWIDAMAAHTTATSRLFYAEARRYGERWKAKIAAADPRLGAPAQGIA